MSQEGSYCSSSDLCRSMRGLQRRSVWGRPRCTTHMDESWLTSLRCSSLYSLGHSLSLTAEIFNSTCWIKTAAAVNPLGECWRWKRRAQWLGWVFHPHVGPLELPARCVMHLEKPTARLPVRRKQWYRHVILLITQYQTFLITDVFP